MSSRPSRRIDQPFGLNEISVKVLLGNESRKPPEERDYRLWKSMIVPYIMKLCIKSADHLAKKDFFGLSDPYVKISIEGAEMQVFPHFVSMIDDSFPQVYKTSVISKTLHPKWNEDFHFSISSAIGTVILDLYDKNTLIQDDFLGRAYIPFDLMDINSQDGFPVFPADSSEPIALQLSLGEKYQWDILTRIPHLQNIYNHLSTKQHRGQLKDHKVTGNLNVELSFHHKEHWDDLIIRYGPSFDQQADMYRIQTNRRRSSGMSYLTHGLGGLFTSLIDSVRSHRSSHDDGSDEENDENDSDNEQPLPEGWEERIDSNRRRMFINHATRTSSLRRPQRSAPTTEQTGHVPRARQLRAFLPRSHSVEEEPPMPPPAAQTSRPPRASFVRQRSHSVGRVIQEDIQQTEVASSERQQQRRHQRTGSFDEPLSREENFRSRWEARVTPQGTNFAGFINLNDDSEPSAPSVSMRQETHEQNERSLDSSVPTAPPLEIVLNQNEIVLESGGGIAAVEEPPSSRNEEVVSGHSDVTASAPASQPQDEGLPSGWESARTSNGRIFYIDHNTETTTWVHPVEAKKTTSMKSVAAAGIEQDSDLPPGWEQRVTPDGRNFYIDHNTRTTTWEHPKRHSASKGPLPPGWEAGQLPDGRVFYMNHDLKKEKEYEVAVCLNLPNSPGYGTELSHNNTLLQVTKETQWADPRIAYNLQQQNEKALPKIEYDRNYKQKYKNFKASLKPKGTIPNQVELPVKRTNLLESSYNTIMTISNVEHLKSRLYVKFEGESGLDYGGLAREWFFLLSHEMFNPYYGLFEYSASDDYTLQINPYSHLCNDNHLSYYKFVGRVCGMAVYHSKLVDAYFIRPFYKMMLKKKVRLMDMQSVDVEFYNSLCYILENDPEPLCLQFSTTKEFLGEVTEVDLMADGRNIPVTNDNKYEYVNLMLKWRFIDRVKPQMDAFMEGFSELIPSQLLSVFDERELEYLLCGLPAIDVEDWKKNTAYIDYKSSDDTIMWFWIAVERFDNETRARLLQFVTGTSKVPMNGFSELQGSNGPKKFTIKKTGNPQSLPVSHTCFNRLDLPPYRKYTTLKEKLTLAVENTEGFAIE